MAIDWCARRPAEPSVVCVPSREYPSCSLFGTSTSTFVVVYRLLLFAFYRRNDFIHPVRLAARDVLLKMGEDSQEAREAMELTEKLQQEMNGYLE